MHYPCGENKGADQLRGYREADLRLCFRIYAKSRFSHDAAHIIVSNINKHLAFESILADCQHGFRSRRSCETQLVQFYHDLVSDLDAAQNSDQKQTDVIIMDFAKAFDKVPHRRLLYKLEYYGIRGSTHKWISSWLSERSQKVV